MTSLVQRVAERPNFVDLGTSEVLKSTHFAAAVCANAHCHDWFKCWSPTAASKSAAATVGHAQRSCAIVAIVLPIS